MKNTCKNIAFFIIFCIISAFFSCSEPRQLKVVMIGFDGISIEAVDDLAARGELPVFAMVKENGATLRLNSFGEMLSPVIWTTVITGKIPEKHGISNFITEKSPKGKMSFNVYSHNRKTKALWNIIPDNGGKAAIINWWGTFPCEKVDGRIVSKQFLESYSPKKIYSENSVYPAEYSATCMSIVDRVTKEYDLRSRELNFRYPEEHSVHYFKDESVLEIFSDTYSSGLFDYYAAYFWQLDQIQHIYYYAYDRDYEEKLIPERGLKIRGNYTEDIITDYYRYYDEILGRIISQISEDTILLLVSDHGFGMISTGIPWHVEKTYGFIYSKGDYIKKGYSAVDIEMVDFVPTVLYILGYPVARDMDGRVISEVLNPAFFNREIQYIDSYDNGFSVEEQEFLNPVEEEQLERLKTLGYID